MSKVMVALIALCLSPVAQAALSPSAMIARVDEAVAKDMTMRHTPGASVAVIEDGKVLLAKSYGNANVELDVPAKNSTLYALASTTKAFTAVAIMTLAEQGKLSLDDSIRKYLPELPASWAPVTLRQCLSHTSGLPDNVADDNVNVVPLAGARDSLMAILETKPAKEPGTAMVYNQTGYMLLGDIIARVSGMPYQTYIDDRLFKPLGITGFSWGDTWAVVPGRATLYTALQPTADHLKLQLDAAGAPVMSTTGVHPLGTKAAPEWLWPAAGLNGNLEAMVTWENALWAGKIITPASLALMAQPYVMHDGKTGDFGLALMHDMQSGHVAIHSGGRGGRLGHDDS